MVIVVILPLMSVLYPFLTIQPLEEDESCSNGQPFAVRLPVQLGHRGFARSLSGR